MKTFNVDVFDFLDSLFSGKVYKLLGFIQRVIGEDSCPDNMTPYLIHSNIQHLIQTYKLSTGMQKKELQDFISGFLEYMHKSEMGLWFYDFRDKISPTYLEYVGEFLDLESLPEDTDLTGEALALVCYYLSGVANSDHPERVAGYKPLVSLFNSVREKDNYRGLMDEYDAHKVPSEDILKSLTPVDVSELPEYIIESLTLIKGQYYRPSEITKAITASSQTAQALEKQDLEDDVASVGLSAEELGRKYIKKLKKVKNETKSNMDRGRTT